MNAYDATILLARAFSECSLDIACVKLTLHHVKDHKGASGTITIASDGAVERAFYLREIVNGKFTTVN